jgi:hypothetical protein
MSLVLPSFPALAFPEALVFLGRKLYLRVEALGESMSKGGIYKGDR